MSANGTYQQLGGIGASPGIAIGRAFIYHKEMPRIGRRRIAPDQVETEIERFLQSLHLAGEEIRRTQHLVETEQGSDLAQIFEAQLSMLNDVEVKKQTLALIRQKHYTAERAFSVTLQQMKKMFERIESEYLRERLGDVMDIENQVLIRLTGGDVQALHSLRANTVVVIHELLPSEAAQLSRRLVKGLVTDIGGATSHTSIIARSMRLPSVVGTETGSREIRSGDVLIVDGNEGIVHVRPGLELLRLYRNELRRQVRRERELGRRRDLPAVTRDGREIVMMANLELPSEIQAAVESGAHGVGLYRTEFLYLGYRLPSEDEQLAAYSGIVEAMAPNPVVIRTLDLGGDKLSHLVDAPPEANPFLGWRGIRICLDMPDLFKTQLQALRRAGAKGEVQVLLPMVSNLGELRRARGILDEARAELRAEGTPFQEDTKLGVMVEVPSVALTADRFAGEVDFFSLGTNDLIQYTLAVDRGTARVASLYDPFHPAVLKLIRMVADTGKSYQTPVTVCGEMAGDPLVTILLVGLGLESLSLSPGLIPEVKEIIRSMSLAEARQVASQCLELETGAMVRRYLEDTMEERLDGLPFRRHRMEPEGDPAATEPGARDSQAVR